MNKILWATAVCGLFVLPLGAEVATPPQGLPAGRQDANHYLEQLQAKLEHTAQRMNQPNSGGSSVVGLRGSKQEPLSKQLYWKGKKGNVAVTPDEIKMFRTAVDEARVGQMTDAIATLKSFQEKFPKSGLKPDAQETIRVLSEALGGVPAAAPVIAPAVSATPPVVPVTPIAH